MAARRGDTKIDRATDGGPKTGPDTGPDTGSDPDHGILLRAAEGDVESFGVLVERHQKRLVRLCERMLGDSEEARDAAQDVFLKAWRKADSYRPRGKVFTWLYRIAVNHCLNQLRRRKVISLLSFGEVGKGRDHGDDRGDDRGVDFDPEDRAPGPAQRLAARQRWHATRRSIEGLPTGQRAVVVLTKFEGLSYRQTAQVLGITEGAVESRLFRAMQNILRAQEKPEQGVSPP